MTYVPYSLNFLFAVEEWKKHFAAELEAFLLPFTSLGNHNRLYRLI
jgi:hypothetical protein